ncbi:MAG TPA: hypothetical protein VFE16_06325 [Candidatus Cybelea sp.]|nr:hypothetical protein [Candidatus Cybelea sp.]
MPNTIPRIRTLAFISGAIFATLIVAITVGNVLIESGAVKNPMQYQTPAKIVFFSLFVALGFSLIPLMVRLVLSGLDSIGKSVNASPFAPIIARPGWIVWPMWLLMASGLAVALPAANRDGFFAADGVPQAPGHDSAAEAIAKMPSQGTLVAAPGMAIASMLADSTLAVRRGSSSQLFSGAQFGGAAIFDYHVAGTTTVFHRCRYYYITTAAHNPTRIATVNVGISPEKMSREQLVAADRELSRRFVGDGWNPERVHIWTRKGIVLALRSRRVDDPVSGEGADAGAWIQYVELYASQL